LHDASAQQLSNAPAITGELEVVVLTDGSVTGVWLNGRGLVCDPVCDGATTQVPANNRALWTIENRGSVAVGSTVNITASQDTVSIDVPISVVGAPRDLELVIVNDKTTIQEGAPSCAITDSITHPTRTGAIGQVVDIDDRSVVGATVTWSTQNANVVSLGDPARTGGAATREGTTVQLTDGPIGAFNVACGGSTGTAELRVHAGGNVLGIGEDVTRLATITVTGVPATVDLVPSPAVIPCDGVTSSTVTATVLDAAQNEVVDGTPVNFSVVALGTANPINTTTEGGQASSQITPLSGATAGVTVVVTAGTGADAPQSSILVACDDELVDPVDPVDPTPAPPIVPPTTGTGFASQGGGFPLWTLLALAVAGVALMGGGLVTRRAGQ
jgi:hypothetical protein